MEVIELGSAEPTAIVFIGEDPVAGAEVVSVSDAPVVVIPSEGGGTPVGPAGGVLSGSYPNPGFAVNMATQAELDSTVDSKIAMHVHDTEPHPAYDQIPDLRLWYRNALI
jgi:hypothetical protein